ncbi:MAG: histidine phosphatase family protein [Dehalococcoidia bacterium]|nr:histidine phosphatase family protein [Dehalococcoidia bacterium]
MKLFLIRHGETAYNLQRRYQGRTDVPLNDVGLGQAVALSRRLSAEPLDKIYASNLTRAVDTARIIASGKGIEVIARENLAEIDFGGLEGLTYEEITACYPEWQPGGFDFTSYGGESLERLAGRMKNFIDEISGHLAESNIAVVAHAGCLRVMLCLLLCTDVQNWWRFSLATASLTVVENVPQAAVLARLNDVSHLENRID